MARVAGGTGRGRARKGAGKGGIAGPPVPPPPPFAPPPPSLPRLGGLPVAGGGAEWELTLAHDREEPVLIWLTRGQGVALLDGARRGVGTHHALFVPARHLFAFEPARGAFGMMLRLPPAAGPGLPATPRHLAVRDHRAQAELTALCEALGREQDGARPGHGRARAALAELVAVWLLRQEAPPPPPDTPARRLSRAYCARLVSGWCSAGGVAAHAAALGVSHNHLNRICRAETGRTAGALRDERRLHAARQLIEGTAVPLGRIANHLGFSGPSALSRFVRRLTGTTPGALRAWANSPAGARAHPRTHPRAHGHVRATGPENG